MFKIKLFSTFYVIMKMQIKATMENTAHLLEWPMSRTQKHQVLLRIWSNRNSHSFPEGRLVQPPQKTVCQFLTKRNTLLLYNPALVLLGIYPEELKTYAQAKASSRIFIASSFITAIIWMHICPSINEWTNKLCNPNNRMLLNVRNKWPIRSWKDMEETNSCF